MESFIINGGKRLSGIIDVQGAKNEALEVISATLLTAQTVTIDNVPDILDVNDMIDLMRSLGVEVVRLGEHKYSFTARDISQDCLEDPEFIKKAGKIRGSLMLAGPLLARFGKVKIVTPGGDKIGMRGIDIHIENLEVLGARVKNKDWVVELESDGKLQGADIMTYEASVTATANAIMAATLANGQTTIYPAACEPYIQQLCKILQKMGAKIDGIASNRLIITGVETLGGCEHTIAPDFVEVGTFIALGAMIGDDIRIKNVANYDYGVMLQTFDKLGVNINQEDNDFIIPRHEHYEISRTRSGAMRTIYDQIWPGLSPDMISVMITMCTQALGTIMFHQRMFESRLFFTDKLRNMGANIVLCDPHRVLVIGHNKQHHLNPIKMDSPDIRAGVSLLIAALAANGKSRISNISQIDRGHEKIDERLKKIGADITRIS